MAIGPENFFRIIQLLQHTVELILSMTLNNCFSFFFCLEIMTHSIGISFRMELSADHEFIKAYTHYSTLIRNMGPHFFNTKDPATRFLKKVLIGLDHLVIP